MKENITSKESADSLLKKLCGENLEKKITDEEMKDKVRVRLEEELEVIKNLRKGSVIHTVSEMAAAARENGHYLYSRGTAASSMISYLSGITDIDPLEQGLHHYFHFGPYGRYMPDFEFNVSSKECIQTMTEVLKERVSGERIIIHDEDDDGLVVHAVIFPKDHDREGAEKLRRISKDPEKKRDFFRALHDLRHMDRDIAVILMVRDRTAFLLEKLQEMIGIPVNEVDVSDSKVLSVLSTSSSIGIEPGIMWEENGGAAGIHHLDTPVLRHLNRDIRVKSYDDLVSLVALSHSRGNIRNSIYRWSREGSKGLITCREDIFNILLSHGIDRNTAFHITDLVRQGHAGPTLSFGERWDEYRKLLVSHGLPSDFITDCEKTGYLFPKAHVLCAVDSALRLAWYKIYHPVSFYRAFAMLHEKTFRTYRLKMEKVNGDIDALDDWYYLWRGDEDLTEDVFTVLRILQEMYFRGISLDEITAAQ